MPETLDEGGGIHWEYYEETNIIMGYNYPRSRWDITKQYHQPSSGSLTTRSTYSPPAHLSTAPPVETGSQSDYKAFDINGLAEPLMRMWQESEALSRMARRIAKNHPDEAKQLKQAAEDVVMQFYVEMKEKQAEYITRDKKSELEAAKELDAARQKKLEMEAEAKKEKKEQEPVESSKDEPPKKDTSTVYVPYGWMRQQ